ncbi:uncharacterized protein ATNIH1004_008531 [Aspergillus tanneri]|uniref:FAD-binding domain-containing protein n=1 Tax=Aspergillus tanneri TaxID=1220188 RepID=A0A5M9MFS8_9EURO|nr:uncharacterized protein ATNIH1004_008531 [Aspergillus tanneri]KAA8644330.1 hypothetical protein ATNIH1004_008531 [Aspergillus tanneri]
MARQKLLEILYKRYPDSSNILTGKRVTEVRQLDRGACVITEDGSVYKGDLIVGADGVHSRIRSEMWRLAEHMPGRIAQKEKKSMTAQYACLFGMSSPIPGLEAGEQVYAFLNGLTIVTSHGKNGRLFWFFIKRLDRKYLYPDVVRFSNEDAAQFCCQIAEVHVWNGVYVRDIWRNREAYSMTALEESFFRTWHYGRMVLLGDSVHKMTINAGQGANSAIEDTALLSSTLHDLIYSTSPQIPSYLQINRALEKYQARGHNRVKDIYDWSWYIARVHARDGLLNTLISRYYIPYRVNVPADMISGIIADAESIQFLPLPERSGPGWSMYSRKRSMVLRLKWPVLFVVVLVVGWWFRGL